MNPWLRSIVLLLLALTFLGIFSTCDRRHRRCPPGHHWVQGHRTPNGDWIRGHCEPN